MGESLEFVSYGNYGLLVHNDRPTTDADWQTYLDLRSTWHSGIKPGSVLGMVVLTDGPGPSPRQRAMLGQREGPKNCPTAILTLSPVVRGLITAMDWLGHTGGKAFKPSDYEKAFDYLQISPGANRAELLRLLMDTRKRYIGTSRALTVDMLLNQSIASLRAHGQSAA